MEFKELTEEQVSDFIVNDPNLIYMGLNDSDLTYIFENKKYKLHTGSYYIGIEKDKELIGILKWEYFTESAIVVHPYISSIHQGKGLAKEMSVFVGSHLKENTQVKKVLAFIMEPCENAIRAVKACGFKQEGHITNCHYWRGELVGTYIFGLDL